MTAVAIVASDPIGDRMNGPAIRAWNMASVLARRHDVRLVSTAAAARSSPDFAVVAAADPGAMVPHRDWADVVVVHPGALRTHPVLRHDDGPVVVDLYDPFHLENLEPTGDDAAREATMVHLRSVIDDALLRGDFFLCASERQRDFWLGGLTALGRVNPRTYDADPTFAALVGVVPFGVPVEAPQKTRPVLRGVVPGIGAEDCVLLWGGGVYNWFDPVTLVDAVDLLRARVPEVRLVFLGMTNPNAAVPPMRASDELRRRAAELGLVGRHVFFNEGWVPYDGRGDYLLEADVGVSTHRDHIEAAFSFRTRILDYLWAGLPYVTSAGDAFADLAEREGVGVAVPVGDPAALAAAVEGLVTDDAARARCRENAARVVTRFHWDAVLAPLAAFCDRPRRAADAGPGAAAPAGAGSAAGPDAPAQAGSLWSRLQGRVAGDRGTGRSRGPGRERR